MSEALKEAERLCRRWGAKGVIIHVWAADDSHGFASWGKDREHCMQAKALAEVAEEFLLEMRERVAVLVEMGAWAPGPAKREALSEARRGQIRWIRQMCDEALGEGK